VFAEATTASVAIVDEGICSITDSLCQRNFATNKVLKLRISSSILELFSSRVSPDGYIFYIIE
jgi:hypothetical protein